MSADDKQRIVLETLDLFNRSVSADPNSVMTITREKESPESAIVRLLQDIVNLK